MSDFIFWRSVMLPLAGLATTVIVALALIKAFLRYHEMKSSDASGTDLAEVRAELDQLRRRLDASEHATQRLSELEERLDFAERLLGQQRAALPGLRKAEP